MVTTRLVKTQKTRNLQEVAISVPVFAKHTARGQLTFDFHLTSDVRSDFKLVDDRRHQCASATSSDVTPRGAGVCFR